MFCTNCGKEIGDSKCCPYCGQSQNCEISIVSEPKKQQKLLPIVLGVVGLVVVIIVGVIIGSSKKVDNSVETESEKQVNIVDQTEEEIAEDIIEKVSEEFTGEVEAPELKLKSSETIIYQDGVAIRNNKYVYDDHGNAISETEQGGEYLWFYTYSYEYYDNGQIKTKRTYGGNEQLQIEQTYTEDGEPLSTINFSTRGNEVTKYEYSYDDAGNVIRMKQYHTYNESTDELLLWDDISYFYDENGRRSSCSGFSFYKDSTYTGYYEYDTDGNLLVYYEVNDTTGAIERKIEYDPVKHSETNYSIYNELNELAKEGYDEYNDKGDLLVAKLYDTAGNERYSLLRMYDYVTDENGNLIEKATYENGVMVSKEIFCYE